MERPGRLAGKLLILGAIGLCAFWLDDWARANTLSLLALVEIGLLVVWLGTDLGTLFRGRLRAGPEERPRTRAIELPLYQGLLAVYLVVLALAALASAVNGTLHEVIDSPFAIWCVLAPLAATGFVLEFRAESVWNKH